MLLVMLDLKAERLLALGIMPCGSFKLLKVIALFVLLDWEP